MNTRKYPRTMQEAFGPCVSRDIQEPQDPMHVHDKIVLWGCAAVAFVGLVLVVICR